MRKILLLITITSACTSMDVDDVGPDAGSIHVERTEALVRQQVQVIPNPVYCEAWDAVPYCAKLSCPVERNPTRVCNTEEFCLDGSCQTLHSCVCR